MKITSQFNTNLISTSCLSRVSVLATLLLACPLPVYANPQGGVVSAGQATIAQSGKTLDIIQSSNRAVIDWRSFDIAPDETTAFHQSGSHAIALNRVNSADPSKIMGTLTANGTIILVNPNGVFFGKDSRVDVNGLVATTADITNANFMRGKMKFDRPGNPNAAIINEGSITAKDAGLVGLVAPNVVNSGVITAKLGRVQLASGDTATIDLYGDNLMEVAVSDAVKSQFVSNTGSIEAAGGSIALTAAAGGKIVNSLINVQGELKAPAVAQKNGKIIIYAEGSNAVKGNVTAGKGKKQGSSTVLVQGTLDVSGRKAGEHGGSIKVLGDNIGILNGTVMDASGDSGKSNTTVNGKVSDTRLNAAGGEILIGGDYLGQGSIAAAKNLFVDTYTLFYNDALSKGDAGRTIFWSDGNTNFKGNVYARGGIHGGNGGFVETSGHAHLDASGYVNLLAPAGDKGTYFLDPADITIYGNFAPDYVSTDGSLNLASNLKLWLDGNDIDGDGVAEGSGESGLVSGVANCGAAVTCVTTWKDKSGNGNDATQGTPGSRPLFTSGIQNGNDGLTFDGSKVLDVGNASLFSSGLTLLQLFNLTDANGYLTFVNQTLGNVPSPFDLRTGGADTFFSLQGGGASPMTTPFGVGSYNILTVTNDTNNYAYYLNAASAGSGPGGWNSTDTAGNLHIGQRDDGSIVSLHGNGAEIIAYNGALSGTSLGLLNQYESAKWNVAITPPGSGGSEVAKATAADGYSAFTTRYLEHLSQNADISLQASHNINLDLKGDTLTIANAHNLSLTTTNGDITAVSAGTLQMSGGNVSLTAGGTGNIAFNDAFSILGAGNTSLTALGGSIAAAHDLTVTGDLAVHTDAFTVGGTLHGSGAGTFTFEQNSLGKTLNIGGDAGNDSSNVSLNDSLIAQIQAGWNNYVFGNANAHGFLTENYTTWDDAVTFKHGSGFFIFPAAGLVANSSINVLTNNGFVFLNPYSAPVRSNATGDAIVIVGNTFIDYLGNTGLSTPNGRWLVYTDAPSSRTYGLLPAASEYGENYALNAPATIGAGNRFVFATSTHPILTVTPTAANVTYGDAYTPTNYGYSVSGYLDANEAAADSVNGTLTGSTSYAQGNNVGSYNIDYASGSLSSTVATAIGYVFSYANNASAITVSPRTLIATLVGAVNKTYNATTAATLHSNNYDLADIYGADNVNLNIATSGSYDTKNAGGGKTVSVNGLSLTGSKAANYTLASTSISGAVGSIATAGIDVLGVSAGNRVYDTTTAAPLNISGATILDMYAGDIVTLGNTGVTGMFGDKNVGNNKPVIVSGFTLSGADAGNYSLNQPVNLTANITPASLSITGVTANNKIYDALLTATLNSNAASLSGVLGSDSVTLSNGSANGLFADKNVGTGKAVTVSGFALGNTDAGNYTLTQPVGLTASITPASLAITGVTASNKTYDTLLAAILNSSSASLSGILGSDAVTLHGSATGTFANKNVGNSKAVIVSGFTLGDVDASNYTLTQPAGLTANITPASLTITGVTANNKTYDALLAATLNNGSASLSGVLGGDAVTLASANATGTFTDKNVGNGKTVTVSGFALGNTDANNYTLTQPTGLTANIIPADLTITGVTANNKTYDTLLSASLNSGSAALSGILGSDEVTLASTGVTGMFGDKNVGNGKNVTVSGFALGNTDASNYTLTQPVSLTANITPALLTITGVTANNKTYDTLLAAVLNTGSATLSGILGSDAVTLTTGSATGTFADKNVGNGKAVAAAGFTLSNTDASNYALIQPTGLIAGITPASLTITANNATRVQGAPNPFFTASYAGFAGGENASLVNGLTFSTDAVSISPVGVYTIAPGGAIVPNYSVAFIDGALTVNAAPPSPPSPSSNPLPETVEHASQTPSAPFIAYGMGMNNTTLSGLNNNLQIDIAPDLNIELGLDGILSFSEDKKKESGDL